MTRVVHVNSKEWAEAVKVGRAVYCGRAVPRAKEPLCRQSSPFSNPYRIGTGRTRSVVMWWYHFWLIRKIMETQEFGLLFASLKDMTLGCWCKDPKLPWDHPKQREPQHGCHCDLIVNLLEELKRGANRPAPAADGEVRT